MKSKNKVWLISVIIGLIIIAGFLLFVYENQQKNQPSLDQDAADVVKNKAPSFSLKNYDGEVVQLSDFEGQPLVINSWAVWCPFCREELKHFAKLNKEIEEIEIIAIDRAESREVVKNFTDELDVTDDIIFLLDPRDSFYTSLGGFAMPETIFIDQNHDIIFHVRGPMDEQGIRDRINKLLDS